MDIGNRKTVSMHKACEVLDVCKRTLYNWMEDGKIEFVMTAGGQRRIFTDTLWRPPGDGFKGPKTHKEK